MVGRSRLICDTALRKIHREVGKNLHSYVTHSKKFAQSQLNKTDCATERITSFTQSVIYFNETRNRWPDTSSWQFLDTSGRKR